MESERKKNNTNMKENKNLKSKKTSKFLIQTLLRKKSQNME